MVAAAVLEMRSLDLELQLLATHGALGKKKQDMKIVPKAVFWCTAQRIRLNGRTVALKFQVLKHSPETAMEEKSSMRRGEKRRLPN